MLSALDGPLSLPQTATRPHCSAPAIQDSAQGDSDSSPGGCAERERAKETLGDSRRLSRPAEEAEEKQEALGDLRGPSQTLVENHEAKRLPEGTEPKTAPDAEPAKEAGEAKETPGDYPRPPLTAAEDHEAERAPEGTEPKTGPGAEPAKEAEEAKESTEVKEQTKTTKETAQVKRADEAEKVLESLSKQGKQKETTKKVPAVAEQEEEEQESTSKEIRGRRHKSKAKGKKLGSGQRWQALKEQRETLSDLREPAPTPDPSAKGSSEADSSLVKTSLSMLSLPVIFQAATASQRTSVLRPFQVPEDLASDVTWMLCTWGGTGYLGTPNHYQYTDVSAAVRETASLNLGVLQRKIRSGILPPDRLGPAKALAAFMAELISGRIPVGPALLHHAICGLEFAVKDSLPVPKYKDWAAAMKPGDDAVTATKRLLVSLGYAHGDQQPVLCLEVPMTVHQRNLVTLGDLLPQPGSRPLEGVDNLVLFYDHGIFRRQEGGGERGLMGFRVISSPHYLGHARSS